jgi:hypothetical protein
VGDRRTEAAELARLKLQNGGKLKKSEYHVLECAIRLSRPTALIRKGIPEPLPAGSAPPQFPGWEKFRSVIEPYVRSVGLILPHGAATEKNGVGTGFLAAPDVLITSGHVFDLLTGKGAEPRGSVRFRCEDDQYETEAVITIQKKIERSKFDIAALKLAKAVKSTPFAVAKGDVEAEMQVAAIGHPFKDEDRNPEFIPVVFGSQFYVKRASPGEINAVPASGDAFDHDCSTLGGNSGSPVVSLKTGRVVGVHQEGFFLERNVAIGIVCLRSFLSKCKL